MRLQRFELGDTFPVWLLSRDYFVLVMVQRPLFRGDLLRTAPELHHVNVLLQCGCLHGKSLRCFILFKNSTSSRIFG